MALDLVTFRIAKVYEKNGTFFCLFVVLEQ